MHQSFTEPITHSQDREVGFVDATLDFLQSALDEAQRKYNAIKNKNISDAQYQLMWQYGEMLAAQNFEQWKVFYRNNVGERCDYEQLKKLFYRFYKLKMKESKLATRRSGWYNI